MVGRYPRILRKLELNFIIFMPVCSGDTYNEIPCTKKTQVGALYPKAHQLTLVGVCINFEIKKY